MTPDLFDLQDMPSQVRSEPFGMSNGLRLRIFGAGMALSTVAFVLPLYQWVQLALSVDLHSHTILIPFVSAYLIWKERGRIPEPKGSAWVGVALACMASAGLLWLAWRCGETVAPQDRVALFTGAYLMVGLGWAFACFGFNVVRVVAFPACLLIFMVPMPSVVETLLEQFLQRLSADAAQGFFVMGGETYLREGQVFLLPGLTIRVAQECSGIRSSLVLVILSLVAAHVMLRSTWRRAILVLAVLPLGILRNGLRVYVITALTLHIDPEIINSPLHHRGGPLFFIISLIPFTALLWILWRTEQSKAINHPS